MTADSKQTDAAPPFAEATGSPTRRVIARRCDKGLPRYLLITRYDFETGRGIAWAGEYVHDPEEATDFTADLARLEDHILAKDAIGRATSDRFTLERHIRLQSENKGVTPQNAVITTQGVENSPK